MLELLELLELIILLDVLNVIDMIDGFNVFGLLDVTDLNTNYLSTKDVKLNLWQKFSLLLLHFNPYYQP